MSDQTPVAEPSGRGFYPTDLRDRDWWVNWVLAVRYGDMDGNEPVEDAAPTKQPVAPYDNGDAEPCLWNSGLDDDKHPTTSFDRVTGWDEKRVGLDVEAPARVLSDELGVGIIIPVGNDDERPVTLLDWDDVRDPETREIHPICAWALDELDGYAEISQSGEGIHQFVYGRIPGDYRKYLRHLDDEPFVGDERPMVEMYESGRVTAMTGRHVEGTGEDVVDGQQLIDELCYRLRNNSNNSTPTPSHPFGDDGEQGVSDDGEGVPSTDQVAKIVESDIEYAGEHPDDWKLDDAPVEYAAVLRGRDRKREDGLSSVANWKLIRYAALLGKEAGLSKERVLSDLEEHPAWSGESDAKRCRRHVSSAWRAAEQDRLTAPSVATLKHLGLLPGDYVALDELRSDGHLTPAQKWEAWRDAREAGVFDATSVVPTAALEHVARDRDLYEFDALDEDADLPPKAHNAALAWLNNVWADEADVDTDEEENATARNYKSRFDAAVETWEDVRYLYEDSKQAGRKAARAVLQDRCHFMTVDEEDALYVYDQQTGVYTDELGRVRAEIYDGLEPGGHWTRHEKNEIVSGLKQTNVVQKRDLNAGDRDAPLRCLANGVLDVVERELHDHSPEYHFTRRLPVKHDPEAATAPYVEFVDRMVEREADRKALFEMVGHTLLPDANARHRLFLILTGDSTNGKSEFFRRVRALLNGPNGEEQNTASVKMSKLAQNRFSQNAIYGSMANIAGEIDGKKIRNTANFKDVTGGDGVELEPKGQESFFDTVNSTQMFAANDPPILGERDKEAIAERIVPVELPYKFVEEPETPMEREAVPQEELEATLETPEALSGLLALALDGIERLEEQNDVSLPEPPKERLRMYEKSADPMREFGERCLTNDPQDYLVKADVTTIYKQFASDRGEEISQNVTRTLHNVLRGVPDLNYTDSRPESPDYTDTALPLRGWDERKRVISRVTLTEEGMEYAEAAGLVEDTASDAGGAEPDVLTPGEVGPDCMTNTGRVPPVKGRSAGKFEDRYGNEKITIEGEDGSMIDLRAEGGTLPAEGATVRVEGARLDTDDLGVIELLVRPTTDVYRLDEDTDGDGSDPDQTTVDSVDTAVADGAPRVVADGEGVRADLDRLASALCEHGAMTPDDAASVPTVWSQATAIADADRVEALLQHGVKQGRFADTGDGGFYLIDDGGCESV